MEKEEILNEYVKLIDKGYCKDCNELNCIDNFPHKKIASAICDLQLENAKLQGQLKKQKEINKKAVEHIKNNLILSSTLDGKKYYCLNDYRFDYKELLQILEDKEV